jgi:hypothetical protein
MHNSLSIIDLESLDDVNGGDFSPADAQGVFNYITSRRHISEAIPGGGQFVYSGKPNNGIWAMHMNGVYSGGVENSPSPVPAAAPTTP